MLFDPPLDDVPLDLVDELDLVDDELDLLTVDFVLPVLVIVPLFPLTVLVVTLELALFFNCFFVITAPPDLDL